VTKLIRHDGRVLQFRGVKVFQMLLNKQRFALPPELRLKYVDLKEINTDLICQEQAIMFAGNCQISFIV